MVPTTRLLGAVKTRRGQATFGIAALSGLALLLAMSVLRTIGAAAEESPPAKTAGKAPAEKSTAVVPTTPGDMPRKGKRRPEDRIPPKLPLVVHIGLYADPRVPPYEGVGDPKVDIKGDADLIKRAIAGDFVVRAEADPESALAQLAKILAADAGLNVKLSYSRQGESTQVQVTRN